MEDWTDLEHDQELHRGKALSQTGAIQGCPRCEALGVRPSVSWVSVNDPA
jgi:hypothetical protein